MTPLDRQRMAEALALAATAIGVSDPNPRVGCIVGHPDGRVLGRGATQQAGGPHAEVMALRDAQAAGHDVHGATAWVTLEPCAHHGRTPPCCDALIAAGIARVVVAVEDPFPQVAGAGLARLRAAGVQVDIANANANAAALAADANAAGVQVGIANADADANANADADLAAAARDINIGFFSRIERGRPWVRMKAAASLDGRTALPSGASQWITGPAARADGHAWRRRAGAVLTGIGTVVADDPRLDVRLVPTVLQPLRVVLDSHFKLPPAARLLAPPGQVLVCGARPAPERRAALHEAGAQTLLLPGADGRVDLAALLRELAARGVNELHVEGGAVLNGALLDAGLVDELLVYLGPMLLGEGAGIAALAPLQQLPNAPALQYTGVERIGPDLRVLARVIARSG